MIEIDGNALHQWDVGRSVRITGIEAEYAHFANKGDSKAVIMGVVDIDAKIPDFLLQTGKPLCVYAVKDGVTLESKTFFVKHRERPENYVYEDDQRNYIFELITNAEETLESLWWAYQDTTLATENARAATENANQSADSATLAAKNANEAADKANHTAKSLMVVGYAEGDSIHLDDAIDQFLVDLRVFGKTTQDGTPTPEAPVDLVSVENPTVTVNDQTLLVPYTLCGIPVTSGGNYTDANGQQWICDEVDFNNRKLIRYCGHYVFNGSETWEPFAVWTGSPSYSYTYTKIARSERQYDPHILCNIGEGQSWSTKPCALFINEYNRFIVGGDALRGATNINEVNAILAENPIEIVYKLETPIETPLTEEELAAFAALRTYRNSTTVSNDASAHMEIEYVMDAKKYIDSLMSTAFYEATVE